jgi:aspartyl-tRNA(Asn)/glutamyl-tRNA(Gln) amidotransferase subunit C
MSAAMTITKETVLHVARLARLELDADEVDRMQRDLGKILAYVAELDALPTEGVPQTAHVAAERAPLRPDTPVPSLKTEQALAEAPRRAIGGFAVPAFMDE